MSTPITHRANIDWSRPDHYNRLKAFILEAEQARNVKLAAEHNECNYNTVKSKYKAWVTAGKPNHNYNIDKRHSRPSLITDAGDTAVIAATLERIHSRKITQSKHMKAVVQQIRSSLPHTVIHKRTRLFSDTVGDSTITRLKKKFLLSSVTHSYKPINLSDPTTQSSLNTYYTTCASLLNNIDIDRDLIINADETQICGFYASTSSITVTGQRSIVEGQNNKQGQVVALLPSITLAGKKLKSFALVTGKSAESILKFKIASNNNPHDITNTSHRIYNNNLVKYYYTGNNRVPWFKQQHLIDYLHEVILPHTQYRDSYLLLDHATHHFTASVKAAASSYNINLIPIPAKATHICQPLDVGVFGSITTQLPSYNVDLTDDDDGDGASLAANFHALLYHYHRVSKAQIVTAFHSACKPSESAPSTTH
jgi:hypothetical protein